MRKRRITLNLDADVAEALEAVSGDSSMSAVASEALREALESRAHRQALLEWLEELNEKYGRPTPEEYAEARAFLDGIDRDDVPESGVA